jgi:hypothetical protein
MPCTRIPLQLLRHQGSGGRSQQGPDCEPVGGQDTNCIWLTTRSASAICVMRAAVFACLLPPDPRYRGSNTARSHPCALCRTDVGGCGTRGQPTGVVRPLTIWRTAARFCGHDAFDQLCDYRLLGEMSVPFVLFPGFCERLLGFCLLILFLPLVLETWAAC